MKRNLAHILPLILAALALSSCARAANKAGGSAPSSEEARAYIGEVVDAGYSRGIAVALINAKGVEYLSYGKTAVDGADVDERTIYEIASITKTFTSLLLADMAKRGEVALGDPVMRYLPASVAMPGGDAISLELLATQRSGLPAMPDNLSYPSPNPYAEYTSAKLYDFLSGHTLKRAPGSAYEYSNTGMGLLGHALSLAAGKSYEYLLRERICDPLGLSDTRITVSEEQRLRLSKGHGPGGRPVPNWDFDALAGCGALRSSAADLARYVQANLGLIKSDVYPAMKEAQKPRADSAVPSMRIGLGWNIIALRDGEMIWHNGMSGGCRSFCGFIPSKKIGVVVLSNSRFDIDAFGLHLLEPAFPLPLVKKAAKVSPQALEDCVGTYEKAPGKEYTIVLEDGRLLISYTGQPAMALFPSSETEFFYIDADAAISFVKDASGKIVEMVETEGGGQTRARRVE